MSLEPNSRNRIRLRATFIIVSLIFFALIMRLATIQVFNNQFYRDKAEHAQKKDIPITAKRGSILDRNGGKIAFSVTTFTVYARLTNADDEKIQKTSDALSKILEIPSDTLKAKLITSKSKLVVLSKGLPKSKADLIKHKKLGNVWVTEGSKRVYPYNNFAAQTIGFVNEEGTGLAGLEYQLNKELSGKDGYLVTQTDAYGRELPVGDEKLIKPVEGYNVELTIDEIIQHFTEKAVDKGIRDFQPKKIMAIVMNPNTGEILSMVTKPDYNPNMPRDLTQLASPDAIAQMTDAEKSKILNQIWRNPIVSDTYEPGSTLKILTTSMGLEEKVVSPKSTFNCIGYEVVAGVKIHCWSRTNPHGHQTLAQGLANSCNPVFIRIAGMVGKENFHAYIEKFGLKAKTGIELPSEARTLVQSVKTTGPVELATMGIGHGISTTPLHVATAISAIANGGYKVQPHIVKSYLDINGKVIKTFDTKVINRVISEQTSETMRLLMEQVVLTGSGKLAYIPGIRVGGKTGTSEKLVNGVYSKSLAYSSFVGLAPVDHPQIVVLVVVDEPKQTNFGSKVAAPIAHDILSDTLRYLKVEPNMPQVDKEVIVPNLVGKSIQQARVILEASSLILNDEPQEGESNNAGSIINKQYPAAGTKVRSNSIVIISTSQ